MPATTSSRAPGVPTDFPVDGERLVVAGGDVHDAAAVAAAIDGSDAVISTLGVPFGKQPVTVYSDGVSNIVTAMHAAGVKRLVAVTSSVMAPHPEPLGGVLFEKVLQPYVVNKLGRTVYDDMRRMESIVTASDLVWTIVRPSGLCTATDVSDYLVAPDHVGHRFTTRIDLADCLLHEAVEDRHPCTRDRRRDAERPPIDAVVDLAGRDPQAVMTQPPPIDTAIETCGGPTTQRMLQLALRMLSDLGDAEDVVQEAFARLARIDPATLDDPEGWLVVVTGRLCLDRLRTRRRHPAEPLPGLRRWPRSRAELPDVASTDPADHVASGRQRDACRCTSCWNG